MDARAQVGDTNDHDVKVRKELRKLAQGCIDHGATLVAADSNQFHLIVDKGNHVKRARYLEPAGDCTRHLSLRGDNDINGHVLPCVQICPFRIQITLFANAGDLSSNVK